MFRDGQTIDRAYGSATRYAANHRQQTKSRHSRLYANIHVCMHACVRSRNSTITIYRHTRKWFNAIVRYLLLLSSYLLSMLSNEPGRWMLLRCHLMDSRCLDDGPHFQLLLSVSSRSGIFRFWAAPVSRYMYQRGGRSD